MTKRFLNAKGAKVFAKERKEEFSFAHFAKTSASLALDLLLHSVNNPTRRDSFYKRKTNHSSARSLDFFAAVNFV